MDAPLILTEVEYGRAYARATDAICRELYAGLGACGNPHHAGLSCISPDDGLLHTSPEARRLALAVLDAVGIWTEETE